MFGVRLGGRTKDGSRARLGEGLRMGLGLG